MKLFGRVIYLTILLCDLTMAAAQEFRLSGNLLTRETWTGPINGSVSYTYDNDLDITSRRVNGRTAVAFSYDADKLLTRVGDLAITRNPQNSLITATTIGNVSDSWSYNEFAELTNYTAVLGSTPLYSVQLTRDALSRIVARTETIGGVTSQYAYTYDLAGRLAAVTLNGVAIATYTYDSNGNRLSASNGTETSNAAYDQQDRLLSHGTLAFTYTANGELATRTVANQRTTYEYDLLGNLTRVVLPDGTDIRYLIDGRNRRVGKMVNSALTKGLLYDKERRLLAELDSTGNVVSEFVYGTLDHAPDYLINGGQTYRIICDHLGGPRLVVNVASGQIAQRMDYDAFGRVLTDTAPGFQPFGFAGGLYDRDIGLTRFRARDYDPETGRWTAKDPILFGGAQPNLYAYVHNDPVNWIDPTGLQTEPETQCRPYTPGLSRKLSPQERKQAEKDWEKFWKMVQKSQNRKPRQYSPTDHDDLDDLQIQR
jgi:RHS repeat-associated protein